MNILMLLMGGSGTRLGGEIPKQYIEVNGVPVFGYILENYNKMSCIDGIIIVSNDKWIDYVEKWVGILDKNHKVIGISKNDML